MAIVKEDVSFYPWRKLQFSSSHRSICTIGISRALIVQFDITLQHCAVIFTEANNGDIYQRQEYPWCDVLGAQLCNLNKQTVESPESDTIGGYFKFITCESTTSESKLVNGYDKKRKYQEWFYAIEPSQWTQVLGLQKYINYFADPRSEGDILNAKTMEDIEMKLQSKRKYMVLVNPVAGNGKSKKKYLSTIAPILSASNIDVELVYTQKQHHGQELMTNLPLGKYDCVVIVGGDGSLHEILQGLMERPDWYDAIRQPLGIVPTGSGNGLAYSMLYQSQEKFELINAGYLLVKGRPHDLDIASAYNGIKTTYSFLSVEWAIIADVDIESENLRALGSLRFTVLFLQKLLFTRKKYGGTIWYLDESQEHENYSVHLPGIQYNRGSEGDSMLLPTTDGMNQDKPSGTVFEDIDWEAIDDESLKTKGWKQVDPTGCYIAWTMNVTHAAADALIAPGAMMNDGLHHIMVLGASERHSQMFPLMLNIETGKHLEKSAAKLIPSRAYRITPSNPEDRIVVDGELVEGPYLEVQVHPGLAKVVTIPPSRVMTPAAYNDGNIA